MSASFPQPPYVAPHGLGDTPVGAVIAFAGAHAGEGLESQGWMECDGRMLASHLYPELFVVLGYLYGGADGQFGLPDYRGAFLRGEDAGAARQEGRAHGAEMRYLIKFTYGMRARSPFFA
ncbi:phage tail protein [Janthinobacterium sp.]|uniref:phage tail protein n=1 Tax=Janthinobacterium sp. TaxID=1871054 RepID=UPI0025C52F35|nr:phage tail protein [Janthinobacterium sp.]NBV15060.1 tail fiber protein [Janthinobacterium sp.]